MAGGSSGTRAPPSNTGKGYDNIAFTSANSPERVISVGTETVAVAITAETDNSGLIFVGFDDDVTTGDGFPLEAGDSITLEVDADQQGLFVTADTVGDGVRWIAVG